MADKVQFDLVSPERLLLSEAVDMVVVPGGEGHFGVLPGHAPFITTVRPGVIEVYANDQVVNRIFVEGGFAEVTEERCTVLAEHAVPVAELDRAALEQQVRDLAEDAEDANTAEERDEVEKRLTLARAKLEAAQAA